MGNEPCAYYMTFLPIWLCEFITGCVLISIGLFWVFRQCRNPKIRVKDRWWTVEAFLGVFMFTMMLFNNPGFWYSSGTMAVLALIRFIMGTLGIWPFPAEAPLQVVTEGSADAGRYFKHKQDAPGGGRGASQRHAAKDKGGAATEHTPLLPVAAKAKSDDDRLYWIDNARYWLETCVIAKHTMVYVGTLYTWNTWWQPGLASFFESFMMPMFCACSGYLSKGTPSPERCLRVVFRAWIPFVIVNVFYDWIDTGWTTMQGTYTNVLNSLEVSWFLCCWIQWRLILPYICAMPPAVAIAISYILSWFSGYWFDSEPTFHQDEVLGFFPYVVTGYCVQLEHIKWMDKPWVKKVSAGVFWCLFVFTMTFAKITYLGAGAGLYTQNHFNIYNYYWLVRDYNRSYYYAQVNNGDTAGYWGFWTVRAVGQVLTWITGMAFFGMVPHTKQIYSEWGTNTIYPYCLQVWYLKLLSDMLRICTGMSTIPVKRWYSAAMWGLNFAAIPFVNAAMASRFVRKWTCFIFNPTWAYRILQLANPDKYTDADVNPSMIMHAISFTGFMVGTFGVMWLSGGMACVLDADKCGVLPTLPAGLHV